MLTIFVSLTLPDGGVIQYGYDDEKRLSSVTYADGTTRNYYYTDARNHWLLTGIGDENGQTFATYSYDDNGRVTSESHVGNVETYSFAYGALGEPTTVTDPIGTSTDYGLVAAGGMYRHASYSQACMDCGIAASTTYDDNGNPAARTNFDGDETVYTFDETRNLETSPRCGSPHDSCVRRNVGLT